jgi:hypothetical protein
MDSKPWKTLRALELYILNNSNLEFQQFLAEFRKN